jgi:hypothetical protein
MFKNKNILISALKNEDKKCHSFFYLIKKRKQGSFPYDVVYFLWSFFLLSGSNMSKNSCGQFILLETFYT